MADKIFNIEGKVVVVTGTSNGIGRAIAELFVSEGAHVYGADRDSSQGKNMEKIVASSNVTGSFSFYELDLMDVEGIDAWIDSIYAKEEKVDALCNVAGVSDVLDIDKTDDEVLDRTMGINFMAPYRICRRVAPKMKEARHGAIVNVASELAFVAQPGFTAYCASKGAVISFTRSLAIELAPFDVSVNALCPGPVDTHMLQAEFQTEANPNIALEEAIGSIPLGRLGQPDEIARMALFMISGSVPFMQGAAIMVDGGKTLL